ncbi:DUF4979 domain-containing protein [Bacteroides congonensis]|jgi:uncharacterized protein YjdB|uniref:DUF4979 domain-containing protein n=1 Tax=Bacteroides congonensis TaxID=1871006 RepID=UPI001898B677|nr:DUF4979 domain-containing protein [Bacteroides congonensis]
MKHILLGLTFAATLCLTACDDEKQLGGGLDEKTLISQIALTNVENGKLTLAASVDYTDSLIQFRIEPEQPTNSKVSWSSSDESVATVTQDGLVHALKEGKTNITVTPEVGFGASSFFELTVVPRFIPVTGFEFTEADKAELFVSEERTLKPALLPAEHTYTMIGWSSDNEAIATVSKEGVVRGVSEGDVTITARALERGGGSTSFSLHVKPIIYIEEITFDEQEDLLPGESALLEFTTKPANATVASLKWESSDPAVVEVSDQGVVTAKTYGEVTITATTIGDEPKSFSTKVKVPYGLIREDFNGSTTSWFVNFNGASQKIEDGKLIVNMGTQNAEKWRGDIALSLKGKPKTFVDPDNYPYLAIKISDIEFGANKGNLTFDTSFGTYKLKGANGHTIIKGSDGIPVYYYDLSIDNAFISSSSVPTTLSGVTEFEIFQFKVADVIKAVYPDGVYKVHWIRTFKSMEDLEEYVNTNN